MVDDGLLVAVGLHKRLGKREVLAGSDLTVRAGEAIGVSGQNGAGKTTLLRVLAGIVMPDRGTVHRSGRIGYAPQMPFLYEHLGAWDHLRYFATARGIAANVWQPRAVELMDRYRFRPWAHEPVATLSAGTRQKLSLALAVLCRPAVLLLDEPYGGFEWDAYLRFWEHIDALRQASHAIVIVSHLFYDRDRLDRIFELRDGKLAELP